ncbi:B-cell CLL/lymphoma 9-like protein isoform X2 [Protopterus annectens]|uniref:B-cell CLL/lymphoma 9-like protein isoform X2 n=1 Tax=Protopterus annectens TaxID=7888 RepID=UPI001CFA9070|nr:B-cell CLL/lymphoma 9-like protein isoform X2 [Protopterus annectens]
MVRKIQKNLPSCCVSGFLQVESENSNKELEVPPSSPAILANQMHPDNKLSNHGKTANSGTPSQHQNVNQGPTCNLGSKGVGVGNHGSKANQISPGNSGLKNSQNTIQNIGSLKGKVKHEQCVSVDSVDQTEACTPTLDTESKDCNVADCNMSVPPQPAPGSNALPSLNETGSSNASHSSSTNSGLQPESVVGASGKPPSQLVYVFTTHLANKAAEAVLQGRVDSIVAYHQQNVPRSKLEQISHITQKMPGLQEPLHLNTPSAVTPQPQLAPPPPPPPQSAAQQQQQQQTVQQPPQNPSQTDVVHTPSALPQDGQADEACSDLTPALMRNGSNNSNSSSTSSNSSSTAGNNHPGAPNSAISQMQTVKAETPGAPSSNVLTETTNTNTAGNEQANVTHATVESSEVLSKEQLEHRERQLQTLRDLERILLSKDETLLKSNQSGNEVQPQQGLKKYEEPLQSIISQTQSLGGPNMEHESPHHLTSDLGQQINLMVQRMPHDNLTPEQIAWKKLQEEYLEDKRRKEEQAIMHQRTVQDMMMQQPIGGMMVRGPPPPYHSKSGEQWPPGMGNRLGGPIDIQDPMQPRGGPSFPGPRLPSSQLRVGGYGGVQNMPVDAVGPMNAAMQRSLRPGVSWPDDMPPVGGPRSFPQGNMPYPPAQSESERFITPRTREDLLRQQLMEKRSMGMQRPMGLPSAGNMGNINQEMEMERIMQAQRQMDSGIFPGENLGGNPMGIEFGATRGMLSPPMTQTGSLRDIETQIGPGNFNMNVNMNMNMKFNVQMTPQQQMLMSQKMRGPELMSQGMTPEEIARIRAQNSNGNGMIGGPQKMMMPSQFTNPAQQGFTSGPGSYPNIPQEMGNPSDMFNAEQVLMPVGSISGTTRLSHIPMQPSNQPPNHVHQTVSRGLGRRPSDLTISVSQMNSPGMSNLKSPTLSQVHSPLVMSPSANLKSPQTPSQLVNLQSSNQSGPLKSPQVLSSSLSVRSPTSSPNRLKSPSMTVPSPGWTASPKTALPSPGINQGKQSANMNSVVTVGGMDQGPLPPVSRNSSSGPMNNTMNPNMPFTSSPESTPTQNPLSLMMSQMSKYAMPSSTPLYHNAIKTIATSDDELMPDRPMHHSGNVPGSIGNQPDQMHLNSAIPTSSHSPVGMNIPGQQPLSHDPSTPLMSSPNPLSSNIPMHPGGQGSAPQNPMLMGPGPQDSMGQPCGPVSNNGQMLPTNHLSFSRLQQSHNPLQSPAAGMPMTQVGGGHLQQHYPPGIALTPDDVAPPQPGQIPPHQHIIAKSLPSRTGESYPPVLSGVASVLNDPDLSDVIRPSPTGIPEFDLSRIIPSEKPSSTLQYFPKNDSQLPKSQPSNLHLINLQNMMVDQPPIRPSMSVPNLPGQQGVQRGLNIPLCHPGQMSMLSRTGMPPQQGMMGNTMHQGMMSPQQSMIAQQMMMQAKQRSMSMSGEMYAQTGHMMAPQGAVMGPPSQQGIMVSHQMRQRSMSLDGQMNYGPLPGNMANLPF